MNAPFPGPTAVAEGRDATIVARSRSRLNGYWKLGHRDSKLGLPAGVVLLLLTLVVTPVSGVAQEAEIFAVRYGEITDFPLRSLIPDAPQDETIDIAMAVWLIRSGDRLILFDTGFFREDWLGRFNVRGFVRPDRVLSRIGVNPGDVTDIVVSHAHWDHMGGLELFPNAMVWIQEAEFTYYTGAAWQPGWQQRWHRQCGRGSSGGAEHRGVGSLDRRRRHRDPSRDSSLHGRPPHLRLAVPGGRWPDSLRLGLRQCISVPERRRGSGWCDVRASRQGHQHRCAQAHGRTGRRFRPSNTGS